jgi:hypothetical protein
MAQLPISDLDFETLRSNLLASFQSNTVFRDYNFDGSALSILLDVLAHDSYYKAYYLNMLFNEAFIDSALLRGPMVSAAKAVGYTPKSARSAVAVLDLALVPYSLSTNFVTVPAGTAFTGQVNNQNYTFSTTQDYTVNKNANGAYMVTVAVYEGDPVVQTYTVPAYSNTLTVPINNAGIDETSLSVVVFPNANSTTQTPWTRVTDVLGVTANSNVFFFQENMYGLFELQFGDGVLGAQPEPGNVISISYTVCNTSAPNGCKFFSLPAAIPNVAIATINLNTPATGGSDKESIDSIRFNAPRNYTQQYRNVTTADYTQAIVSQFQNIQAVSVWGGEHNTTPDYGKVYISVKPTTGFTLTASQKSQIQTALAPSNVMAIQTVLIDPTFNYIVPQVNVWFNSLKTSLSATQILANISATVQTFETNTLGTFQSPFYFSRFAAAIDGTDPSILGNDSRILVQKRFTPQLNSSFSYALNFHQAVVHPYDGYLGAITSTGFTVPLYAQTLYITDDGYGNLVTYYLSGTSKVYVAPDGTNKNIGTVNYSTGLLQFTLPVASVVDGSGEIQINMAPVLRDVTPGFNEILLITQCNINLYDSASGNLVTSGSVNTAGDTTTLQQNGFATAIII